MYHVPAVCNTLYVDKVIKGLKFKMTEEGPGEEVGK